MNCNIDRLICHLLLVIRGAGLAYGASIEQDLESGLVYLSVYKSPDSYAAFDAARDLISKLVLGEVRDPTNF